MSAARKGADVEQQATAGWVVRDPTTGAPIGVGDVPTAAVRDARGRGHARGVTRPADGDEYRAACEALAS